MLRENKIILESIMLNYKKNYTEISTLQKNFETENKRI